MGPGAGGYRHVVTVYIARPAIAVAICGLVAFAVQDASTTLKQLSLATPLVAGLGLSLGDMNRRAFAVSGYSGAVAFGFVLAALDVADTVTGYDLNFLVEWALLSGCTGGAIFAANFIWAGVGEVRTGIAESIELRAPEPSVSDRPGGKQDQCPAVIANPPVGTSVVSPAGLPAATPVAPSWSTAPMPFERGPDFDAEELVAALEAYAVNGQPWWKCSQPNVMVQYRGRAQLELESRVVAAYGWRRENPPPARPGFSAHRKPGTFSFSFTIGRPPPEGDLVVLWTRN